MNEVYELIKTFHSLRVGKEPTNLSPLTNL